MTDVDKGVRRVLTALAEETEQLLKLTARMRRNPAFLCGMHQVDLRNLLSGSFFACYMEGQDANGVGYCWRLEVEWPSDAWQVTLSLLRDATDGHGQEVVWSKIRRTTDLEKMITGLREAVSELIEDAEQFGTPAWPRVSAPGGTDEFTSQKN